MEVEEEPLLPLMRNRRGKTRSRWTIFEPWLCNILDCGEILFFFFKSTKIDSDFKLLLQLICKQISAL